MRLYPEAVHKFVDDPANGVTSPNTREAYTKTLRRLAQDHPDHKLGDYTEDELVAFCARPTLAPASQRAYRVRVQKFFTWAKWRGLITENPAEYLDRYVKGSDTKPVRQHHWLPEPTVRRLLDELDRDSVKARRDEIVLRLGFTAGLRRSEITQVRWSDLDLRAQSLTLVGKGRKLATVFVTDPTARVLEKWRAEATEMLGRDPVHEYVVPRLQYKYYFDGGPHQLDVQWDRPISPQMVGEIVNQASEQVGIPFKPHDMRRSYAGILEDRGLGIEQISAALRHSNVGTTQRYLEKRQDAAYQAVKGGLDL